jgi:hypothetical protein
MTRTVPTPSLSSPTRPRVVVNPQAYTCTDDELRTHNHPDPLTRLPRFRGAYLCTPYSFNSLRRICLVKAIANWILALSTVLERPH